MAPKTAAYVGQKTSNFRWQNLELLGQGLDMLGQGLEMLGQGLEILGQPLKAGATLESRGNL